MDLCFPALVFGAIHLTALACFFWYHASRQTPWPNTTDLPGAL